MINRVIEISLIQNCQNPPEGRFKAGQQAFENFQKFRNEVRLENHPPQFSIHAVLQFLISIWTQYEILETILSSILLNDVCEREEAE